MGKNKLRVYMCGRSYVLESSESENLIMEVSKVIDKKYQDIFESSKRLSSFDAVVMLSLDLVLENIKLKSDLQKINSRVAVSQKKYSKFLKKFRELNSRLDFISKKNVRLKNEIDVRRFRNILTDVSK